MSDEPNKGLGPFPGGNNPFTCDMLRDERRCGGDASQLYRTATATKVVCDACATVLRTAKGRMSPAPIVEFALVELIPARNSLLSEIRFAKETIDGNKAHIRQLMAALDVYERIPGLRWLLSGRVRAATVRESGK